MKREDVSATEASPDSSELDDTKAGTRGPPLVAGDLIRDQAIASADNDEFQRASIAARIADLVTTADPPLNVALFGAWGSGKSSMAELLRQHLKERNEAEDATPSDERRRVALVKYDAWKFGGHSLKRNFVSNAASQLGFSAHDPRWRVFHRGLYEKRRRIEFQPQRFRREIVFTGLRFFALLLVAGVLFAGAAALFAYLTDQDIRRVIKESLPKFMSGGAMVAFVAATLRTALDSAKADVEQEAPSADEEFSAAFRRLIGEARRPPPSTRGLRKPIAFLSNKREGRRRAHWERVERRRTGISTAEQAKRREPGFDRVVFFIDELDRCSEEDVVTTLVAIRTFLDEDHCVFVVAADRAVLEQALEAKAEQPTPVNEDTPYYSSAGAFLDKIFQHQLMLPPLRGRSLTRFARDVAKGTKGGLWAELAAPDVGLLDDVIHVLIPSHVRSPRRVKVLLNAFATNVRIAQTRDIDWPGRAMEMAKLTVLRTEFPLLADELFKEPRLPRYLLDENQATGEQAQALVKRFSFKELDKPAPRSEEEIDTYIDGARDPADGGKTETKTTRAAKAMSRRHREQLKRYLQRTTHVPDLRRDLLYLEAAGESFEFSDPALGERIEDEAADAPYEVIELVGQMEDVAERNKAARLLADMVQNMIGPERTSVLSALLAVASDLGGALDPRAAADLLKAIAAYRVEKPLEDDQLVPALNLGLHIESVEGGALVEAIFNDERLLVDNEQLADVGALFHRLADSHREKVQEVAAERFAASPLVVTYPFQELPEPDSLAFIADASIQESIAAYLTSSDEDKPLANGDLVDALLDASWRHREPPSAHQLASTLDLLLDFAEDASEVEERIGARWDEILSVIDAESKLNRFALRCWAASPTSRWAFWADRTTTVGSDSDRARQAAVLLIPAIFSHFWELHEDDRSRAVTWIETLAAHLSDGFAPDDPERPIEALRSALEAERWWVDASGSQAVLHEAARSLAVVRPEIADHVYTALADDLVRPAGTSASTRTSPLTTNEGRSGIREMAVHLPPARMRRVFEVLADLGDSDARLTRATLAAAAYKAGDDSLRMNEGEIWEAAEAKTAEGDETIAAWLVTQPPWQVVAGLPRRRGFSSSATLTTALTEWSRTADKGARTELVKRWIGLDADASKWIAPVAQHELTEAPLFRAVRASLEKPNLHRDVRLRTAMRAAALRPKTQAGQRSLADLILWAWDETRPKNDVEIGLALMAGLGPEHGRKIRLEQAAQVAAGRASSKLSHIEMQHFASAGVSIPEEWIRKRFRDRAKEAVKHVRETASRT
jgi:hypothetical protein